MSEVGPDYHMFCEPMNPPRQVAPGKPGQKKPSRNQPVFNRSFKWSIPAKTPVVAMALTNEVLYVATTPEPWLKEPASGQLVAIDPTSGKVLWKLPLPTAPVFDGMAAATGGLYIALRDGRIACLAPRTPVGLGLRRDSRGERDRRSCGKGGMREILAGKNKNIWWRDREDGRRACKLVG